MDFLTRERGTVAFARFLRDALQEGYEPALRKHYNYRGFDDLQADWGKRAFGSADGYAVGLRGRSR